MPNIPIPRLIEMIHDLKHPLLMDSIIKEHYVREHKKARESVHEGAKSVFIRFLILGAVKKGETSIYLP